ncbi:MAG TPA: HD domain-containing protein [Pseudonocardiaceae bacterium]|nr:HD domain-containing protein [Pseudonocardiaceae bacterium]
MDLSGWATLVARRHLATAMPRRWAHVQGTARQAEYIGNHLLPADERDLLIAAAVLHDVGYATPLARSGFHPLDGAWFLADAAAPPRLCALVAHHSAAAVTARLRGLSAELAEFEDERSLLRDALWYCDLTTDPDGELTTFDERIADIRARHGPDSVNVRALDSGGLAERTAAVRRVDSRLQATRSTIGAGLPSRG